MNKSSRREFLRVATASSVVAGLAPTILTSAKAATLGQAPRRRVSPNEKLGVATIGMGIMGFGDTHMAKQVPEVQIVGVADLYDGRLTHAKEMFGSSLFTTRDYRELLARPDVDVVIIATPDHWHVPMAVEALKAGKHVYLEKPAVHRVEEGPTLIAAANASGKVLQVGSQRVSSVIYHKAREMYESGVLGKLNMIEAKMNRQSSTGAWQYTIPPDASPKTVDWDRFLGSAPKRPYDETRFFRWRNYWDYGTAIAGDLFVHLFSGIHTVVNSHGPDRIFATGGLRYWEDGRDVPDVMMGMYDYPATEQHPAFTLSLQVNFAAGSGGEEVFRFIGDSGMMTIKDGEGLTVTKRPMRAEGEEELMYGWNSVRTFSNATQGEIRQAIRAKKAGAGAAQPSAPEEIKFNAPAGYNEHQEHFNNFFETIRTGKPNVEDATFGYRAAAPAVLSNKSYVEHHPINWDPEAMKVVS